MRNLKHDNNYYIALIYSTELPAIIRAGLEELAQCEILTQEIFY